MKKKLAILILAVAILALWVTPALAAQGQITEVNPSGVGTVVLQADDGDDINPGEQSSGNANDGNDPAGNRNEQAGDNGAVGDPIIDGSTPNNPSENTGTKTASD